VEFWSARDLMPLLGYKEWRKFAGVIEKARDACKASDQKLADHFVGAANMILTGKGAHRKTEDFLLTRYACYLVLQNGDPRKPEIALSQTYFATQTRRQELLEQREKEDKRLDARRKLKQTEKKIESTVYERGITLPIEFASFKDSHIKALYGGIGTVDLKKRRNIPTKRALADFDTHVELSAKNFALAMTDHNIAEKNIQGKKPMTDEVVKNSFATRKTLLSRGIIPETLKPEADIKKIEVSRKGEKKMLIKKQKAK
jgi:DNA-damage-inducible protein D